jgi:hypothetical protein
MDGRKGDRGDGTSAARRGEGVSAIDQILATGERDLAEDAKRSEGGRIDRVRRHVHPGK